MFRELYAHQEWADATVWRAVMQFPAAKTDKRVHDLLLHLHMTQRAFLMMWRHEELSFPDLSAVVTADDVLAYARDYHRQVDATLDALPDPETPMPMPWAARFRPDPGITTLRDTLLQVPMHSTYHRGQVNARLRELGAEPPLVDYIAWIWMKRPAAQWP